MKAIVIHAPHDLRVQDFALPEAAPGVEQVSIRMAAGGICGSDLHYYNHGGFGTVRITEPMTLGHEASGYVDAVGPGVTGIAVGDLVAVNPSQPCTRCPNCRAGLRIHCTDMRFNGSAMRQPHEQGLFRERITVETDRVFTMPAGTSPAEAALCEPLAVCLHAASHAGDLTGKTVMISGCGPIGILTIAVAKLRGAARIIATDITRHSLDMAQRLGATDICDVSRGTDALAPFAVGKGQVDVVFECSGNPKATEGAIALLRPRGKAILIGLGGDAPVPVNTIVARELQIFGTFRFDAEFGEAARLIGTKAIDLSPAISATYPMADARAAFEHAGDRTRATKVVITLSEGTA